MVISRPIAPVADVTALEAELRATADALLEDALEHLSDPERSGIETAVHETRKRIKETRALLRLFGEALVDARGSPAAENANQTLREAARGLGESRDAAVMQQTLEVLAPEIGDEAAGGALESLRQRIARRNQAHAAADSASFKPSRSLLEQVRGGIAGWRLEAEAEDAWTVLAPNVKRIYRRGRKAMHGALGSGEPEPWHAWRRRAKDLRYALELLRGAAPEVLEPAAALAKKLTDALGEDHDLAVLAEFARKEGEPEWLKGVLDRRSDAHRVVASRTGKLIYAETPGRFVRRMGAYWRAACGAVEIDLD